MGRKLILPEIGETFGKLTVVKTGLKKGHIHVSKCKCECGKTCIRANNALRSAKREGIRSSCGCMKGRPPGGKNLTPAWSIERTEAIIAKRQRGATSTSIAKEFGLSRERVCQILRKFSLSRRRNIIDKNRVLALVNEGKSFREISKELGTHDTSINNLIHRHPDLHEAYKAVSEKRRKLRQQKLDEAYNARHNGFSSGRLTFERRHSKDTCWFKCECGERVLLRMNNVKSGATKSCGCWRDNYSRSLILGMHWDKTTGTMSAARGGSQLHESRAV